MAATAKVTGTPLKVRKATLEGKTIYCVDFNEGGKSKQPKGLPKPNEISFTVLMNEKQWKKSIGNEKELPFLLVSGEITLDIPMSFLNGEFGIIAIQVEKIEKE